MKHTKAIIPALLTVSALAGVPAFSSEPVYVAASVQSVSSQQPAFLRKI